MGWKVLETLLHVAISGWLSLHPHFYHDVFLHPHKKKEALDKAIIVVNHISMMRMMPPPFGALDENGHTEKVPQGVNTYWKLLNLRGNLVMEMDLSLVGLQNAGKMSLLNAIAAGGYSEDMIPTVGFNMRKVTKGNVSIRLWDLGGQKRFRTMWERYCRGVTAIVYVVDAADRDSVPISLSELHELLSKPSLSGIPSHCLSKLTSLKLIHSSLWWISWTFDRSRTGRFVVT